MVLFSVQQADNRVPVAKLLSLSEVGQPLVELFVLESAEIDSPVVEQVHFYESGVKVGEGFLGHVRLKKGHYFEQIEYFSRLLFLLVVLDLLVAAELAFEGVKDEEAFLGGLVVAAFEVEEAGDGGDELDAGFLEVADEELALVQGGVVFVGVGLLLD